MRISKKAIIIISSVVVFMLIASVIFVALFTKPFYTYKAVWGNGTEITEADIEKAKENAPKTFTVEFNGTTYNGEYVDTILGGGYGCIYNEYSCEGVVFGINSETEELVSISLAKTKTPYKKLDEKGCLEVANAVADDYIKLENYKVETTITIGGDGYGYVFTYYREFNGIKAKDEIHITVFCGRVTGFVSRMANSFSKVLYVAKPNDEKAKKVIYRELNKKIEEGELPGKMGVDKINFEIQQDECFLVKSPNGKIGCVYTVLIIYNESGPDSLPKDTVTKVTVY